ncbi:MOXD1 2 isoform X1 [Vespula squamosa]|uniref:MOXD1 2 isoform X1 n=1 Tax=Vespula squamosa TaxID=30214 RepID=A0ABD1ZXG5_VESSQ
MGSRVEFGLTKRSRDGTTDLTGSLGRAAWEKVGPVKQQERKGPVMEMGSNNGQWVCRGARLLRSELADSPNSMNHFKTSFHARLQVLVKQLTPFAYRFIGRGLSDLSYNNFDEKRDDYAKSGRPFSSLSKNQDERDRVNIILVRWIVNEASFTALEFLQFRFFQLLCKASTELNCGFEGCNWQRNSPLWYPRLLQDRHMKDVSKDPEVDSSQDYRLLLGYENKTHTVLRFSRRYDTCDSRDLKITLRRHVAFDGFPLRDTSVTGLERKIFRLSFSHSFRSLVESSKECPFRKILENSRLLPGACWSSSFAPNPLECSVDEVGEEEAVGARVNLEEAIERDGKSNQGERRFSCETSAWDDERLKRIIPLIESPIVSDLFD